VTTEPLSKEKNALILTNGVFINFVIDPLLATLIGSELKSYSVKVENEILFTIWGEVRPDKWS
jgi:hypothetical protein